MSEEDLTVYVTKAAGSLIASKVNGYFTLRGERIKFRAIAFGRTGGHNVNIKLTKKDEERIRKMGLDPEEMIIKAQRKMVEGDMIMPDSES